MAVNPAQLAELSALLEQALDIPAAERQAWLASPPTTDPVVLAALSRALQLPTTAGESAATATTSTVEADQPPTDSRSAAAYWLRSGRFSEMGFTGVTGQQGGVDASIVAGATMDRYRLLHPIGSGGMGTVWLAERIEGDIVRPVALKLPLRLCGNRQIAERFARERGVLAKLTHPNIATLYDAGVSDAGVPFLALEYVEGQPITDYADGKWLTVAARLALFSQVLAAVQHAHESLVIHRDLKPSNILVKADGTVKLLDFGIAKLIEEGDEAVNASAAPATPAVENGPTQSGDASQQSELTQQVGIAVTPNYASPEQLAGESLTTATDVYSLGVVLYELLTGTRPYRLKRENQAALVRGILDAEVVPPSHVALTESAATLRRSTPAKLKRLLHGDLDAILAKGLEKTTDKRYRTAEEFAADLRRYQQHEPVQAVPSSTLYRVKKYVTRNRIGVAATVAVSLAVLAGIGATLWQLRETERELARRTAVQTFLVGIFKTADPEIARGKVYTAKELLSVGVERIDKQFANQPEVAAALYGEIGMIFSALGDSKTAAELFAKKLKLLEAMGKTSSANYVDALTRYGRYLHDQGRREEALPPLEKAVALAPALGATFRELRWSAMRQRAMLHMDRAEYSDAEKLLEIAHLEQTILSQTKPSARAQWLTDEALASLAIARRRHGKANTHLTNAERHQRDDPTSERIDILRVQNNLAVTEIELRRFDSARSRLEALVVEYTKTHGDAARDTLIAKTELAKALLGLGRADEALRLHQEALVTAHSTGDAEEINYSKALAIRTLIALRRYAEAESFAKATFDYFSKQPAATAHTVTSLRVLLTEIYFASGQATLALVEARRALAHQTSESENSSLSVAHMRDVVGAILRTNGDAVEALARHRQAFATYSAELGRDHVLTLRSQLYLALASVQLNLPGAAADFGDIAARLERQLPSTHHALRQIATARTWVEQELSKLSGATPSGRTAVFCLLDI